MKKLPKSMELKKIKSILNHSNYVFLLGDLLRLIFSIGFASLGFLIKVPLGLLNGCIIFLFIPLAAATVTLVDLF